MGTPGGAGLIRKFMRRVDVINKRSNPELVELLFSCALLAWGLWVINPYVDCFDDNPFYKGFVLMARSISTTVGVRVNPEMFWGSIIALSGALQLYALLSDARPLREFTALWATFILMFIGGVFQWGYPKGPSIVWFACFAWAERWAYNQIGRVHQVDWSAEWTGKTSEGDTSA